MEHEKSDQRESLPESGESGFSGHIFRAIWEKFQNAPAETAEKVRSIIDKYQFQARCVKSGLLDKNPLQCDNPPGNDITGNRFFIKTLLEVKTVPEAFELMRGKIEKTASHTNLQ